MTLPQEIHRQRSLHPGASNAEIVRLVAALHPECSPRWIVVTINNVNKAARKQLRADANAAGTG